MAGSEHAMLRADRRRSICTKSRAGGGLPKQVTPKAEEALPIHAKDRMDVEKSERRRSSTDTEESNQLELRDNRTGPKCTRSTSSKLGSICKELWSDAAEPT